MKALLFTAAIAVATVAVAAAAQENPTPAQTQAARSGPCGDPWITIAYQRIHGPSYTPERWMCTTTLYNGGSWGSFAQLLNAVRAKNYGTYRFAGVKLGGSGPLAGKIALGIFNAGTLVAAGGGNLIAAGAGNLVAAGGGNLVAAGGGNIISLDQNALFSPGPRTLLSASSKPVPVMN